MCFCFNPPLNPDSLCPYVKRNRMLRLSKYYLSGQHTNFLIRFKDFIVTILFFKWRFSNQQNGEELNWVENKGRGDITKILWFTNKFLGPSRIFEGYLRIHETVIEKRMYNMLSKTQNISCTFQRLFHKSEARILTFSVNSKLFYYNI